MMLSISNKNIFPSEALELFRVFHKAGFFEESMLIAGDILMRTLKIKPQDQTLPESGWRP